jgi:uncharacterized integral membrane protein
MLGRALPGLVAFERRPVFRRIVTAVIVIPLAAIIIVFAVANRQWVTVSFDPFSAANPAYAANLPLFALIFVILILGVIIGGIAAWIRQGKWRRRVRELEGEVHALHDELAAQRRQFADRQAAPAPEPFPVIAPPVP